MYKQSAQTEAIERELQQLENAIKAKTATREFVKKWGRKFNSGKGYVLPFALVVWNVYNTLDAMDTYNRHPNAKNMSSIASNIGYLGQSVMALWMGPVWDRYYKAVATPLKKTNAIRLQNGEKALEMTMRNIAAQRQALADLAPKIFTKVAILNTFMAIGAIGELPGTYLDLTNSSNGLEKIGQAFKFGSLMVSGAVGLGSGLNWIAMLLFEAAWVMGPWVPAILFWAGIAYLVTSLWIMYFHREGIALWLDNCVWGDDKWNGANDKKTQLEELKELYKIILEPAVFIGQTRAFKESFTSADGSIQFKSYQTTGFWLQLSLPAELKNETTIIKTLLVKGNGIFWYNSAFEQEYQSKMASIASDGVWSSPLASDNLGKDLPENPQTPAERQLAPFDYEAHPNIERYIYTVWVPYEEATTTFLSLKLELPLNTGATLLQAPGIDDDNQAKQQLDYAFEHELITGLKVYEESHVFPAGRTTLELKQANEVYINKAGYNKDTMTYTVKVGQTIIEKQS